MPTMHYKYSMCCSKLFEKRLDTSVALSDKQVASCEARRGIKRAASSPAKNRGSGPFETEKDSFVYPANSVEISIFSIVMHMSGQTSMHSPQRTHFSSFITI